MQNKGIQEEFKQVLEYAYQAGNADNDISVQDLIAKLSDRLKRILNKD